MSPTTLTGWDDEGPEVVEALTTAKSALASYLVSRRIAFVHPPPGRSRNGLRRIAL